jgi:adenosine kinase
MQWLSQNSLSREFIRILDNHYTGQAYITTDEDDNQITAFHPGAMSSSHLLSVPTDRDDITIGIVSPDGKDGMLLHAEQFAELGIPFIFDPGQGMPMFNGEELVKFLDQATWAIVNDYESELLQQRTGLTLAQIADRVEALVVTLGAQGSKIYTHGQCLAIPAAKAKALLDPTGCGDAYRAGLLYGLMNEFDWDMTGRIASLMGAIKIEHNGTQNHALDMDAFKERYHESFGSSF